jgi:phosphocarrier protein HPr
MIKKTYTIIDKEGMHARPASLLTKAVIKYQGRAELHFNGKKTSLKSIIGIMGFGIKQGESFDLEIEGENEADLLTELEKVMFDNNLVAK